jgi:hypothetical protein
VLVVALLAGCAPEAAAPGDAVAEGAVAGESLDQARARLEDLVVASMAQVRPGVTAFDEQESSGPSPCEREGLAFAAVLRAWRDVPRAEGLAALDTLARHWTGQGLAVDRSRRDRPVAPELLARTPQDDTLVAIVGEPSATSPGALTIEAETACLPDPRGR